MITTYTLVPRSHGQIAVHDARTGNMHRVLNHPGTLISAQVNGTVGMVTVQEIGHRTVRIYDLNTGNLTRAFQA